MTQSLFTSRLPGFYQLSLTDRVAKVADLCNLSDEESEQLSQTGLAIETADQMVENVIGTLGLPVGLGLNFRVNGATSSCPWPWRSPRSSPPRPSPLDSPGRAVASSPTLIAH